VLRTDLNQFLAEFLFATTGLFAQDFDELKYTIKEIFNVELVLRKFSRRWVSDSRSDSQKIDQMRKARHMLDVLLEQRDKSFNCIVTSDKSWFVYRDLSDHMFASGRENVIPREKQIIGARKVMLTIFFSRTSLINLDALSRDQTYIQEYVIENILSDLVNEKRRNRRSNGSGKFCVPMNNSMYHNDRKMTKEISNAKFESLPHSAYSPDLSPCNFWLFGMLQEKMKDRAFQAAGEILEAVTLIWNAMSPERLQFVFLNWMERLEWVIANRGGYYFT
jgi:histone-lysine N-methyltransferase SETMAR